MKMKNNTNSRMFFFALLTAFVSVLWLNVWHQASYRYGISGVPLFQNWMSDTAIIFLPVLAAVWLGVSIQKWLVERSNGRLSDQAQPVLSVILTGLLVSAVVLLIETSRSFQTEIGKGLALSISICGSAHLDAPILGAWLRTLPTFQGARIYVTLQDLASLILANFSVAILFHLMADKAEAALASLRIRSNALVLKPHLNRIFNFGLIVAIALGGYFVKAEAMPMSPTDESKVPHYFGPWPNWANSPFRLPDVTVEILGGGGTGATAAAAVDPVTGALTDITVTSPGSGYTSAPSVVITSGFGAGASATASVDYSGVVTNVNVDQSGGGYTAPVATISGGGATTAATAIVYGGVDAITVTEFGSGYTMPVIEIGLPNDPAGIQATAHVEFDGVNITGIVVDNPGSGYSTAPVVTIHNGTLLDPISLGGGIPASAVSTLTVQAVFLDDFGSGYTSAPTVDIIDSAGVGTGALATASIETSGGAVTSIVLDNTGAEYMTPGIKKFTDQLPGLCMPPNCPTSGKYIPLGVPEVKNYNGIEADEYVIGLVQYRTSFSSSLPDTLVRGYVQIETAANSGISQHFPLVNEMLDGTAQPVTINGAQVYAVTAPQYLGPTISAVKDRPVRIVFYNLLPTGVEGDLFLPTDSSMMGSGMGPMAMADVVNDNSVVDEVRNPPCGEAPKPDICFKDNRATLHLHGGATPWISDGTPHQWITPAGENTQWPEGVSVENVPDMNVCNSTTDGCQTFYYTNQQSARLMFYHDHSWGITRLNVYAGEAAGYLITDATEQALINDGIIPADQLPLIIQDKTFVPSYAQMYEGDPANGVYGQDPTWDAARWGGEGNLWYHHVYMPAQNPGDASGMSAYGRWMYGPWFWPPAANTVYGPIPNPYYDPNCNMDDPSTWQYQTDPFCEPEQIPGTPNVSAGMEQFNDTPLVNGVAYPTTTVEPKSYRLRILNAANDRFFNLQLYVADPTTGTESEVALDAELLAAAQLNPNVFPTPDTSISSPGPDWIQIGTEGGFLPAPVVIDGQQVTTWITDPTRFDVGNVDQHSLLLAPAERADVIVDFSQFAGKTLILYNDAPAAFPARIPSYDYYTGTPDLSPNGASSIVPGYGPNTRTVMQIKVADAAPAPAYNLAALQNAFSHKADGSGVFESSQHPIIVGQAAYNSTYGTNFNSSSNCNVPNSTKQVCDGLVRINDTMTFGFNTLLGQTTKLTLPIQPKAIHDEMNSTTFDEFGRMQANLGVEAQPPTPGMQNVTLYPYVNPATEFIDGTNLPNANIDVTPISSASDGTQIWRITHNGVDTHPIHFHLYDVQVINRVTWDNIIIPPDPNELGWKDTVRIAPLEDTIVALRPIVPSLPFEIPNSIRPLNPMMPLGSTAMFNNVNPNGIPTAPIINQLINFGWEYVYHCHILSHEEMDMMRPVTLALPPLKADGLAYTVDTGGGDLTVNLSWNDNSIAETAYLIQRMDNGSGTWSDVGSIPSPLDQVNTKGARQFADTTVQPNTTYQYRIVAQNTVGYGGDFPAMTVQSTSDPLDVAAIVPAEPPAAPSNLAATMSFGPQVQLQWTDNATNETGFTIQRCTGATCTNFADIDGVGLDMTTYTDATVTPNATYRYRVVAFNFAGNSLASNVATTIIPASPAAPTNLVTTVQGSLTTGPRVRLVFRDNQTNTNPETGFQVFRSENGGAFTLLTTLGPRGGTGNVTYYDYAVLGGGTYSYYIVTINASSASLQPSNTAIASLPPMPAVPGNFQASTQITNGGTRARVNMIWTDASNNETRFVIQRATDPNFTTGLTIFNRAANTTSFSNTNLPRGTTYYYRIRAENAYGKSEWVLLTITTP